jgi:ABC-type glycerol-3-phosphate transport system permease component
MGVLRSGRAIAGGGSIAARQNKGLSRKGRERLLHGVLHIVLLAGGITMLIPFIWLLSTALKPTGHEFSYPPQLIPDPVMWSNFNEVLFGPVYMIQLLLNTVIVTALSVIGTALSSSLVAYGFARFTFPGRSFWFVVLLGTMMLPTPVTIIPRFILFRNLGWINTWLPLFVPAFLGASAYNIFLLRQFFMTIPYEYDEAALIDGASKFRIWWQILLPLSLPAMTAVVVLTFLGEWNSFFEPLIYISSNSKQMMGVGLAMYRGIASSRWNLMMAGAFVQLVPVLIVFFVAQRAMIKGIVMTGLTGR